MRKIIEDFGLEFVTCILFLAVFEFVRIWYDATHTISLDQLLR